MGAPRLQLRRAATFAGLIALAVSVSAAGVHVADAAGFRAAVAAAKPGTRILLAGGTYRGGFHFVDLR
ncbi:MAG: hypothetical protein JNL92_23405, partial [Opitutaceae bacterium]|nr:hypothetical protein [Opitutaceae bacterium]